MVTVPLTEAPARQQDSLLVPNFSSEALCETMVEVLGVETFASGAEDTKVGLCARAHAPHTRERGALAHAHT